MSQLCETGRKEQISLELKITVIEMKEMSFTPIYSCQMTWSI